jgi:hypothetical protein
MMVVTMLMCFQMIHESADSDSNRVVVDSYHVLLNLRPLILFLRQQVFLLKLTWMTVSYYLMRTLS